MNSERVFNRARQLVGETLEHTGDFHEATLIFAQGLGTLLATYENPGREIMRESSLSLAKHAEEATLELIKKFREMYDGDEIKMAQAFYYALTRNT